ncbi:hypothetical protein NQ318_010108 [Aromia moschata]|uniref:DUF4817 domain-containing protein n=1 Tax=Aromia moschata TaxID=1265417 RepID=A0AAV8YAW7_9CUCU|nr:hypothetical protein NQ318_010108 [Aromia moschata]
MSRFVPLNENCKSATSRACPLDDVNITTRPITSRGRNGNSLRERRPGGGGGGGGGGDRGQLAVPQERRQPARELIERYSTGKLGNGSLFVLQFRETVYLTEMHKITILQLIGYGDPTRTQAEVVRLFQEKYPELPPISQDTVSKIEKQFRERGHVRQLKKNPPNKLSDDQKLDVMLMLEENPHTSSRQTASALNISYSSILRVLTENQMHPYKLVSPNKHTQNEKRFMIFLAQPGQYRTINKEMTSFELKLQREFYTIHGIDSNQGASNSKRLDEF